MGGRCNDAVHAYLLTCSRAVRGRAPLLEIHHARMELEFGFLGGRECGSGGEKEE